VFAFCRTPGYSTTRDHDDGAALQLDLSADPRFGRRTDRARQIASRAARSGPGQGRVPCLCARFFSIRVSLDLAGSNQWSHGRRHPAILTGLRARLASESNKFVRNSGGCGGPTLTSRADGHYQIEGDSRPDRVIEKTNSRSPAGTEVPSGAWRW
jgi:hypothetical protein